MTAKFLLSLSTTIALLGFSPTAFSATPLGTVTKTEGFVYKKNQGKEKFSLTSPKTSFYIKEPFKTAKKSLALLQLEGGFQIKIAPQSELSITRGATPQSARLVFSLARGGVYLNTLNGGSTEKDRGFQLQLGNVSINGSSGKIFIFRQDSENPPNIFVFSQSVSGKISHPFGKTQHIAAGEAYYVNQKGSRKLQESAHKEWVEKLNWSFRGDMEPEDYALEFPKLDK